MTGRAVEDEQERLRLLYEAAQAQFASYISRGERLDTVGGLIVAAATAIAALSKDIGVTSNWMGEARLIAAAGALCGILGILVSSGKQPDMGVMRNRYRTWTPLSLQEVLMDAYLEAADSVLRRIRIKSALVYLSALGVFMAIATAIVGIFWGNP
jgi:hypothetical protein